MLDSLLLVLILALCAYLVYIHTKILIKIQSMDLVYNRFDELAELIEKLSAKIDEIQPVEKEKTEADNFYVGSNGLCSYRAYDEKMREKYDRPRDVVRGGR